MEGFLFQVSALSRGKRCVWFEGKKEGVTLNLMPRTCKGPPGRAGRSRKSPVLREFPSGGAQQTSPQQPDVGVGTSWCPGLYLASWRRWAGRQRLSCAKMICPLPRALQQPLQPSDWDTPAVLTTILPWRTVSRSPAPRRAGTFSGSQRGPWCLQQCLA